jgi:hypothetical protein
MDRRHFLVTSLAGWTLWRIDPGGDRMQVSKAGRTLEACESLRDFLERNGDHYVEIDRDVVQLRRRQRPTPPPEYHCRPDGEITE